MSPTPSPAPAVSPNSCPLDHLGVIQATGPDAASFLQGQLTQDVLLMPPGTARLAAFCSAKGRMTASFWVHKRLAADGTAEFLMVCRRDILAATLKRLSMFVLRAKVKLSDVTAQFELSGWVGESEDAIKTVANYAISTRENGQNYQVNPAEGSGQAAPGQTALTLIPLPAVAGLARAIAVSPLAPDAAANDTSADATTLSWWLWSEVASGVAMISPPVVDAFVPQMLNYESVGGVNFKKGCYPGQEVVARSQFRGTLKRRAYLVHSDAPMAAGDEVFSASDAGQPCGLVAQAAAVPGAASYLAIVSMQVAAAQAATDGSAGLTLKSADGPGLVLQPLPYALLDDI